MSRGASILVIEDEFLLAIQVEAFLTAAGWSVVGPAATLSSAVELARNAACDAAMLDINLKGKRIDEVTAILAARGIPFLFATGYGRESLPAEYRDNTIVIAKPYNERQLVEALRGLLPQVLE